LFFRFRRDFSPEESTSMIGVANCRTRDGNGFGRNIPTGGGRPVCGPKSARAKDKQPFCFQFMSGQGASMKIVSEMPEEEIRRLELERKKEDAENDACWAMRALAANILRIVRGAGKDY
jgi:hypothetical protein